MLSLSAQTLTVTAIFAATYVGMALGRVPGFLIDRTGIALFAAVAVAFTGAIWPPAILASIDFPTLCILFGLMALSAQFVLAGYYDWCAARIASSNSSQMALLGITIVFSGALSAVLANDVVTFAIAPVLARGLTRRGVDAKPHLIALAAASNAGSAATLIGNPQNILIGQRGGLKFLDFLGTCGPPAVFALVTVFLVVRYLYRDSLSHRPEPAAPEIPQVDFKQVAKGGFAVLLLVALFILPVPHALGALAIAALLLISRRFATREIMAQVDWHLLLLFACLFVVNAAFRDTGLAADALAWIKIHGYLPDRLGVLAPLTLGASITIGNVPAVILMLSMWLPTEPNALYALALLSTLAGNFLLTGSFANIIVVERAKAAGVTIGFREHARCGIPIALISMAVAILWLALACQIPW